MTLTISRSSTSTAYQPALLPPRVNQGSWRDQCPFVCHERLKDSAPWPQAGAARAAQIDGSPIPSYTESVVGLQLPVCSTRHDVLPRALPARVQLTPLATQTVDRPPQCLSRNSPAHDNTVSARLPHNLTQLLVGDTEAEQQGFCLLVLEKCQPFTHPSTALQIQSRSRSLYTALSFPPPIVTPTSFYP